jgi:hypothetical protein
MFHFEKSNGYNKLVGCPPKKAYIILISETVLVLELVQTKDMYYRGITHALLTISREEGLRGLYKGLGPTLMVSGLQPSRPPGPLCGESHVQVCTVFIAYIFS